MSAALVNERQKKQMNNKVGITRQKFSSPCLTRHSDLSLHNLHEESMGCHPYTEETYITAV